MAKHFDLRRQLKLHDKELLRRLATAHGALGGVPWDELGPHEVEPIAEAWEDLPDDVRRQLQVVLQDVNELGDARGQKVLIEELQWRAPVRVAEFAALRSPADKSLWTHLEVPAAFDQAAIFARAEALRNGLLAKRWNGLPPGAIAVTEEIRSSLEAEIRDYYWNRELRGEVCRVHDYQRPGGEHFIFAYLPDWPDKRLVMDANGELTPREEAYAFSNVFIFHPEDGSIELIAKGGLEVHAALRKAFGRAVFGLDLDDADPYRTVYHLDHLLDPSFAFTTTLADRIEAVRLRRIRLVPSMRLPGVEYAELKFTERADRDEVDTLVGRQLSSWQLDRDRARVTQVGIQIVFASDGHRRGRKMTFNVSCPNTCDLKSKPDDVRAVGERCIREWGILRD